MTSSALVKEDSIATFTISLALKATKEYVMQATLEKIESSNT